jgi:hypothetical protein
MNPFAAFGGGFSTARKRVQDKWMEFNKIDSKK